MPNRIIKESTFTSDRIAQLNDFQFRLWVGLITQADDAGRGDARPAIIKGRVFALRDRVSVKDIDEALHALAAVGCVSLYKVGGKPYYQFPSWAAHQRVRDVKPKYPGPEDADAELCGELPQTAADCGLNPIQSEPNPNTNPNPIICAEQGTAPAAMLPLNDGSMFAVPEDQVKKWEMLYQAVDVRREINKMIAWLDANPKNRKTKSGIMRFCNAWLSRAQDQSKAYPQKNGNVFEDLAKGGARL